MAVLPDWQQICARKRAARDDLIPKSWLIPELMKSQGSNLLEVAMTCGVLTEQEIRITTEYDAVGIVAAIRDNTCTAEEVTTAFCKRAAIAQQLVCTVKL